MDREVGRVIHWYDRAGVAVMKLTGTLRVGDTVKIKKGERESDGTVISMQVNHLDIGEGKAGEEVAVKLSETTKEGAVVYLVS